MVADLLEAVGIAHVVTVDLHTPQIEGFFFARVELPANAQGALMTYMVRGRQYIVIPVGGANFPAELIALALP
jgi:phosphoribosylpyrophosphate synthetase